MGDVLRELSDDRARGTVSPWNLKSAVGRSMPQYNSFGQQDAHEFFLALVGSLHDELRDSIDGDEGKAALGLLSSQLDNHLTCKGCNEHHKVRESFRDFSLELEGGERGGLPVMLRRYFSDEGITATCEVCSRDSANLKKTLVVAPRLLALHLKRFRWDASEKKFHKINQSVTLPMELDLREFSITKEPLRFRLHAVVVHDGTSPRSGHYVTYARREGGDSWLLHNDSDVRAASSDWEELVRHNAYVLFYAAAAPAAAAALAESADGLDSAAAVPAKSAAVGGTCDSASASNANAAVVGATALKRARHR